MKRSRVEEIETEKEKEVKKKKRKKSKEERDKQKEKVVFFHLFVVTNKPLLPILAVMLVSLQLKKSFCNGFNVP